jgi:signal transduction histidine kinase
MDTSNKRTMLRMMMLGFGMVLLVLGLAIFVAARDSDLRADTTKLIKEHLVHAQLLSEVQAQEDVLWHALHRIDSATEKDNRKQRCAELVAAVNVVKQLAQQAATTPQATEWARLATAANGFSEFATQILQQPTSVNEADMQLLLSQHDAIVKMIHDMVMENTKLWTDTDEQMALDISDLADDSSLMLIACFLLAIIFAAATVIIVRKGIQRIEWQRDELNRVSWHMLQTQEDTARRFSHEMHDELGQSLAAVRANLSEHNWMHEPRRRESMQLVDEAIANVRELSQLLRPVILDDFGLEAALRSIAERFGQRTRIDMKFACNFSERIESKTETHLFRIAQEALTNIARHSRATSVDISLTQSAKQLCLTIQDNGIGMPKVHEETSSSLGLIGMRARARECGGTLTHETIAPQGVKITVTVPYLQA